MRWAEITASYYQINLLKAKPHVFANLVYAWAVERVSPDNNEKWHQDLEDLLPWQDANSEAAIQSESDSFMSAMNAN